LLPKTKAHIGLLFTNFFFAVNLIAIKYFTSNGYAAPYGLNMIRIGVSVILFWIVYLFTKEKMKFDRKDIVRFLLCALTALAINQMLFMKGLSYTYSIHVSLLLLITPIVITFIAAWILKEKLTILKILGLFAGISGASLLIHSGINSGNGHDILLGDFLIILSAFSYTFYFILVKPLMFKYSPIDVMRWVFTLGFFMIIPLGYKEFTQITWNQFSFFDYFLLFIIVVPGTFLAYIFNVYGIKVLSASVAGTYIYLQPLFAVLFAMLFLKEELTLNKIIAAILIFTGVYLANYKRRV
jgi:drug/metabolite transporter (DMT)-like permease